MSINVALDGPSGAGKSTIAKTVAAKLGFVYVDTGALYRSIAYYAITRGADVNDGAQVAAVLDGLAVRLTYIEGAQAVLVNGENVSDKIRTPEISMAASAVSKYPEVRAFLLDTQRSIAAENDIIMDGRDIGTVVLPNAQVKVFLTASAEERANRRYKELSEKGDPSTYEEVLADINQRDYNDTHREIAPLKQAEEEMHRLSDEIALCAERGEAVDRLLERYDALQTKFERDGGYSYKSEIGGVLSSMAFDESFFGMKISVLSGGERTRLALACMLLRKPDLLMLDEVLSVGDGSFRQKSGNKMREILANGVTGILVSHSIDQVRELCNKVLWLDHGKQMDFGETQEVCDRYEAFMQRKK